MALIPSQGGSFGAGHASIPNWSTKVTSQRAPFMAIMPLNLPTLILGLQMLQGAMASAAPPTNKKVHTPIVLGQFPEAFPVHTHSGPIKFWPKKRHLKPEKLFRRMGEDFATFWMSHKHPDAFEPITTKNIDWSLRPASETLDFGDLEAKVKSTFAKQNLTGERSKLATEDVDVLVDGMVEKLKTWLVRQASCPVHFRWKDMGLLYWPRWVREGRCVNSDDLDLSSAEEPPSCSWPPGMRCVPARAKTIKILRWRCKEVKHHGKKRNRADGSSKRNRQSDEPVDFVDLVRKPNATFLTKLLQESDKSKLREILAKMNETYMSMEGRGSEFSPSKPGSEGKSTEDAIFVTQPPDSEQTDKPLKPRGHSKKRTGSRRQSNRQRKRRPSRNNRRFDNGENNTEKWNKDKSSFRKRKSNVKCKWFKVPIPVIDNCYCSC